MSDPAEAAGRRCFRCREWLPRDAFARNRSMPDGLSEAELAVLLEQCPVCPICLINEPKQVDHDHVTGRVRGILCFTCDAALGQLRDDPEIIRRAAAHVEGTTELKGVA